MDPAFLNNIVNSIREVLLRSSGSKRLMAFFVWLLFLGLVKPDFNTTMFTGATLGMLWLLFQADGKPDVGLPTA